MSDDLKALMKTARETLMQWRARKTDLLSLIVMYEKQISAIEAHDCMATVEAFCGKPTETDRADNAEAERDRLRQALVLIEVQVSSDESRASNVLATIGRMARAALAGRPL